jgi:hypothetical protein
MATNTTVISWRRLAAALVAGALLVLSTAGSCESSDSAPGTSEDAPAPGGGY